MITLIIFLSLFFILLFAVKVSIEFKLKIVNEDLDFTYKSFFKERHIKNKIGGFIKSGSAEFDKNVLLDVSEVIDIEEFKTKVIVNTPIVHFTNLGVLFFSYLIPRIYNLPFRKKKGLYFKVMPSYTDWSFYLFINGKIRVRLISVILIIFKIKRKVKEKTK